ncbi:MAG: glycosyltransferase family 2 protein [Planctomycetota bacterium]
MIKKTDAERATVDVVIVTYQSAELIEACLDSVPQTLLGSKVNKIVVDSASEDGTRQLVASRDDCELIALSENRGFAQGVNRGLAASQARFVLLLNPDAELGVGALQAMVRRLEADPGLAAVAPIQINERGEPQTVAQAQPTVRGELARTFEVAARPFGWTRPDELEESDEPGWLSGACLLLSREALLKVGPLDGGYFLYFEETDWCRRAIQKGYRLAVERTALVLHVGGASSIGAQQKRLSRQRFERSRRRFFIRHHGRWRAFCVEVLHLLRRFYERRINGRMST